MNGKLKNRLKFHFQGLYRNVQLIFWIYYIYLNLIFQLPTILPTFCKGQSVWWRDWCCLRKGKNACLFYGSENSRGQYVRKFRFPCSAPPVCALPWGCFANIWFCLNGRIGQGGKTFLGRLNDLARFVFASGVNLPFGCWPSSSFLKCAASHLFSL